MGLLTPISSLQRSSRWLQPVWAGSEKPGSSEPLVSATGLASRARLRWEDGECPPCGFSKVLLHKFLSSHSPSFVNKKIKRLKFSLCRKDQSYNGLGCPSLRFPLREMGMAGGGTPNPPIPFPPCSKQGGRGGVGGWLIAWRRPPGEDRTEPPDLGSHGELEPPCSLPPVQGKRAALASVCPSCGRMRGVGIQLPRHHAIQPRLTIAGADRPGLDSWFYCLLALWYWTSALTSLGFSDPSTQIKGVKPTHSEKLFKIGFVLGTTCGMLFFF